MARIRNGWSCSFTRTPFRVSRPRSRSTSKSSNRQKRRDITDGHMVNVQERRIGPKYTRTLGKLESSSKLHIFMVMARGQKLVTFSSLDPRYPPGLFNIARG